MTYILFIYFNLLLSIFNEHVIGLMGKTSESNASIKFSFIVRLFINNPFAPASSNFADVY